MRVLLLSFVFPPRPEVGALRAANLLSAFREAGHQVTLITEPLPGQAPAVPAGAGPAVRVITVEPGVPYATRISGWLRRFRSSAGNQASVGQRAGASEAAMAPPGPLRQFLLAALSVPDDLNYSIGAFTRAGSEVLREGTDLIYSSGPPFSLHLSARRLRSRSMAPWVAEFRDPWSHPGTSCLAAVHPLTRGLDRALERRVLTSADAIVMATESAREYVAQRLPAQLRERILVARNGIPDWGEPPPVLVARRGPFRIVHTGTFYMGRDPSGFFEALALYVGRSGITPSQLRIELIGDARHYQGTSVDGIVERLGLREFVQIEDWLPHAEVRERLFRADALLLFAQGQPLQVPNKLYEYLAVRRPILGFVDQQGESARILRDFPESHLFFHPDPERMVGVLRELLERPGGQPLAQGDAVAMASLSTRVQMRELVAELERRFG